MISWIRREWLMYREKCKDKFKGQVQAGITTTLCLKSKNVCCMNLCPLEIKRRI